MDFAPVLPAAQGEPFVAVVEATMEALPGAGSLLRCGEPWVAVAHGPSIQADGDGFMLWLG